MGSQSSVEEMQEGMSIKELLHILKVRLGWIIGVFIVVVAGALVYLQNVTPLYESQVTILVDSLQKGTSIESMLIGQSTTKISTEVELTLSRSNIESALSRLDLTQYKNEDGQVYRINGLADKMKGNTNVSTVKDTNIVRITVTDQNPLFARDFANALADSYDDLLGSIARNSKTVQKEFIESQIPVNERQLQKAADALGQFREESRFIQLSDKSKLLSQKIAYFQLRREPLALQLKEAELAAEVQSTTLKAHGIAMPTFAELQRDVDIEALLTSYMERSRELIMYEAIQESISEDSGRLFALQSALSQIEKTLLDRITLLIAPRGLSSEMFLNLTAQELAKALHQQAITSTQIAVLHMIEATYTEELAQLPILERQLLDLQRDVQVYETLRMRLMELLEEVKIAEAAVAGSVTVVDPAIVNYSRGNEPIPVSPNKMLILAVAVLLGGALGILLALMVEMLDVTIKDEGVLRKLAGPQRPLLGWVPLMNFDQNLAIPSLVAYNSSLSFEAERYKLIANNLTFSTAQSSQRIFSITSPGMGEGKTSVTANVATSMAINGSKVLLVDGDLRLPQIETFFNLKKSPKGLVDAVTTNIAVEEVIVQPLADIPSLHILPPGLSPPAPSAIFNSPEYVEMLDYLLSIYDFILIDTPPLVFASELMSIAKHVDGLAINIRAGVSTKGGLRELIDNLDLHGVNIIGVIFNGVIESKMGGHYSSGRYYTYQGSSYAKRYYSSRYNTGNKDGTKKATHTTKVRGGYRKNFLKDLKQREKERNLGTLTAIHPFIEKRDPFGDEHAKKASHKKTSAPNANNFLDPLQVIESDPRAKGRQEE
ncbi:MAG: polysaccharide biosynthesis tyrosine autokinase [Sphaerochaetaceae bacterium]|nr:polysaccharide biosynthesis tyrosine autokinase [Sphaerochaetaceae bacterium]